MKDHYYELLVYINNYWQELATSQKKDKKVIIGLPNKFICPSVSSPRFKGYQFYWDTYFIILGLIEAKKIKLAKGMVDNLIYLFKRFDIIPLNNRFYNLGISQIPFLTSMAQEIYNIKKNKRWLKKVTLVAEKELNNYWMDNNHLIHKGLSRYADHYLTHLTAEQESGWDMTSRFNQRCLNRLPIDLNSALYKYEIDLSEFFGIIGNKLKKEEYLKLAKKRKKIIMKLLWDKKKGFFFDYNHKYEKRNKFYSLAGFYPLWANMVSKKIAIKVKNHLKNFEYKGGLAVTQKTGLKDENKQWDYPNGWANLHWIVIKGLMNYGFNKDAERIARKWLDLNKKIFLKTGKFWEKYDVVKCKEGKVGRYPIECGFAWTNSIFLKLVKLNIKK